MGRYWLMLYLGLLRAGEPANTTLIGCAGWKRGRT